MAEKKKRKGHHHIDHARRYVGTPFWGSVMGPHSSCFTADGFDHNDQHEAISAVASDHADSGGDASGGGDSGGGMSASAAYHDLHYPGDDTYIHSDEDLARHHHERDQFHRGMEDEGFEPNLKDWRPLPDQYKDHWHNEMARSLSRGDIHIDQAKKQGYEPEDDAQEGHHGWKPREPDENDWSVEHRGKIGGWGKLPHDLYHVTTNMPAVQSSGGLKTRHELEQTRRGGMGLGGGSDHTISVTTDPKLAHDVYHSLHEYHAALNGHKTVQHMQDDADHHGWGHWFNEDLDEDHKNDVSLANHGVHDSHAFRSGGFPRQNDPAETFKFPTTQAEVDQRHPGQGWVPHPESAGHTGGLDRSGRPVPEGHHDRWMKPGTEQEITDARSDIYKKYTMRRSFKVGHRDPLFVANDTMAFKKTDPKNFGIMHFHPSPTGHGYPIGDPAHHHQADSGEWRTHTGEALDTKNAHWTQPTPKIHPETDHAGDHMPHIYDEPETARYYKSKGINPTPNAMHPLAKLAGRDEAEVMRRWLADSDQLRGQDMHSQRLHQMMGQAPVSSETRHRGAVWEDHQHLKPGDTLHMRPSSFTHDPETAHQFAWDRADERENNSQGLHIQVHGPHPELNPYEHYQSHEHEGESILGGQFRVTHVQPPSGQNQFGGFENPAQLHLEHMPQRTAAMMPQQESPWRPHERMFAPGKEGVDPRLFNGMTIKRKFRDSVMKDLDRFWGPRYGFDWQDWAIVYLAGGEASHWYNDHNDLDILIGVDYGKLGRARPAFQGLSHAAVSKRFNDEFRTGLNSDHFNFGGETWERTFYVNPDSYDIRRIKPYAAYDLTHNKWAVKPLEAGVDWGPDKINPVIWHFVEHSIRHVRHILNDLRGWDRTRQAREYYEYLHTDRSRAFGPYGDGLVDRGNVILKALDMHPDHLLERLIAASKGEDRFSKAAATYARPSELIDRVRDLGLPRDRSRVDDLKRSIQDNGYQHGYGIDPPIRAAQHPEDGWAISNGHHRLKALHELGMDDPIQVAD